MPREAFSRLHRHAAKAVADQDRRVLMPAARRDDGVDVIMEGDSLERRAVEAVAGKIDRHGAVAEIRQQAGDITPAPARLPCAMHEYEGAARRSDHSHAVPRGRPDRSTISSDCRRVLVLSKMRRRWVRAVS